MKTKILVFCFLFCVLFGTAAFAQVGSVLSGDIGPGISFTSHPSRAIQAPSTIEQNLLANSANMSGHGERPLWEFAQPKQEVPLGDIAREYRKQRAAAARIAPTVIHQN
jgi:hypothetical protein